MLGFSAEDSSESIREQADATAAFAIDAEFAPPRA
jgi:hypothetical protein